MGKKPGRPPKGSLADLSIPPQPTPEYRPPPLEECEAHEWGVVLRTHHELRVSVYLWQERYMVKFAIMQLVRRDGDWREVSRIDTCHATVHKHQLHRNEPGNTVGNVQDLVDIPAERGWEVIDSWYQQSLTLMHNDWQENLRLWGGDYE